MNGVRGKFFVLKACQPRNSAADDIQIYQRELCYKEIKWVELYWYIYLFIYNGGFR
jgi:hypothetical protein